MTAEEIAEAIWSIITELPEPVIEVIGEIIGRLNENIES